MALRKNLYHSFNVTWAPSRYLTCAISVWEVMVALLISQVYLFSSVGTGHPTSCSSFHSCWGYQQSLGPRLPVRLGGVCIITGASSNRSWERVSEPSPQIIIWGLCEETFCDGEPGLNKLTASRNDVVAINKQSFQHKKKTVSWD